jgi:Sugar (and other) transporter.
VVLKCVRNGFSFCAAAGTEDTWHYLLGLFAVVTLLSLLAFPFLPESPKYLYIVRGQEEKGIKGM